MTHPVLVGEHESIHMHRFIFTTALSITSRVVQVRDRLLGRVPRGLPEFAKVSASRHSLRSDRNLLDAVYVQPTAGETLRSALLICHGIGETAPQWIGVQRLLAESGIASLVFDYSGYGRSTGRIDWRQCERDAVAAFEYLAKLAPGVPVSLLGFSLGSGVAPAVLDRVKPFRLILCAGYVSFRKAARAVWIPPVLDALVPPIWFAEDALRDCNLPTLIVHGDRDRLFGLQMAQGLVTCSEGRAKLLILPARSHNSPVYFPRPEYWNPIAEWILQSHPQPA